MMSSFWNTERVSLNKIPIQLLSVCKQKALILTAQHCVKRGKRSTMGFWILYPTDVT